MSTSKELKAYSSQEIERKARRIKGWDYDAKSGMLEREYQFPSFPAALHFVRYVGELAELAQHHPDIDVRYNRVRLALVTHDAGGVTDKDFDLISQIDHR